MILLLAGLGLLTWGAVKHADRLIVAGGVLSGLGLAIAAETNPWAAPLSDAARAGLFLLGLAAGWLLITPLSRLAAPPTLWWPLAPAAALSLAAALVWLAPAGARLLAASLIPLALAGIGLSLIIIWGRTK